MKFVVHRKVGLQLMKRKIASSLHPATSKAEIVN